MIPETNRAYVALCMYSAMFYCYINHKRMGSGHEKVIIGIAFNGVKSIRNALFFFTNLVNTLFGLGVDDL